MAELRQPWTTITLTVLGGLLATTILTAIWHVCVPTSPRGAGYEFTQWFTNCLSWKFATAYLILSISLGWALGRGWLMALGMMVPLPIAFLIEVIRDHTSHNLFPFEVLMYWIPAFVLSLLGLSFGRTMGLRFVRSRNI